MSSTRTEIPWGKTLDWNSFDFCFQYKSKLWKHDTLIVFGIWRWCCHRSHTGITSFCGSWAFILMLYFNPLMSALHIFMKQNSRIVECSPASRHEFSSVSFLNPLLMRLPCVYSTDNYIRIDCGGSVDFTNNINETWMSDKYFTGGTPATVMDPGQFVQQQERTVRFFPIAMGKKNCYVVNVPNGRYFIRMFFVYDDYDRQQHSPSFDVSVEGTVVFSWRNPWQDYFAQNGAYSDLFAFIHDGAATVCFYSIATDSPVIGALELLEVDELSYDSQSTGESVILVNYGRLMTGYESFGPGFTNDTDELGRGWEQDDFYSFSPKSILTTTQNILNTTLPPNYFPEKLYQACRSLAEGGSINYVFEVDSNLDYAIWLHFAEIDPSVKAQGQRVFDVRINNQVVLPNLDIYKLAGGPFSAYDWHFTVVNLTGSSLTIDFEAKIGPPLICGLEVYALLTADLTTNVTEGELYSKPRQSQLWIRNIKAFEMLKFLGACSGVMLWGVFRWKFPCLKQ